MGEHRSGASLAGGSGTMFGTLVGPLIIGVVDDGLALLNVSPYLQQMVLGAVIVLAVMADRANKKSAGRGWRPRWLSTGR